jgi:hypothetical protein
LDAVIKSAHEHPRLGTIAGLVGIGVTLFSASAVFAQLQGTLNRVWRVKAKPGEAVGAWLRARARAFALLGGVAFLLIVSFVVSAIIQGIFGNEGTPWTVAKYAVSVLVFAGAFTMMFKVLPDALIDWKDALIGAGLTTVREEAAIGQGASQARGECGAAGRRDCGGPCHRPAFAGRMMKRARAEMSQLEHALSDKRESAMRGELCGPELPGNRKRRFLS